VTVPVIGWAVGSRGNGSERFFDGQIDEVRIYRRGLAAVEVAALAANRATSEQPVWVEPGHDDRGWAVVAQGFGFAPAGDPLAAAVRQDVGSEVRGISPSVYSRYPFRLTAVERVQTAGLTLRVRADDGYVAWLNGTRVASRQAPAVVDGRSAATAETPDAVALAGESMDLTPYVALLREGENVLALQLLNVTAEDDDALLAVELDSFRGTPGMSPLAQSYDAGSPPVLQVNTVLRARSWVPSTRSWSALSESFHQVGAHACPPGWLVCSELHFNPRGDEDGEFIELLNAGPGAVNLRGARFVAGISYAFPVNRDTLLAPGERLVLADNAISFQRVHGWAASFGGVFSDNLSNAGERIAMVSADGQTVLLDFTYDGRDPWPGEADSGGRSLVLIDPRVGMDLNDPANWRASVADHGNPNAGDAAEFRGDPRADADGDGRSAWEEFALGTSELVPDADPVAVPVVSPVPGVEVDHALNADAAAVRMAGSGNLIDWTMPMSLLGRRVLPDGRVRSLWGPAAPAPRAFFRLRVPPARP
jgi:hypothetical protein